MRPPRYWAPAQPHWQRAVCLGGGTGEALGRSCTGGRRPLVQLSPSASSPLLSRAGDFTFRLCPSDLAYGAALARFADQRGFGRAAMLFVNDEYGRGVRKSFEYE